MTLLVLTVLVFVTMVVEAARAARNERAQMARGGIEPPDDVYRMMRVVYPVIFIAMLIEGALRAVPPGGLFAAGAAVFAGAKLVKWSAIHALGHAWTFRVIVVPGDPLVVGGPYRYLRHPNYVGVVGEIVGVAIMTRATVSGPLAALAFGALLVKRLAVEERALGSARARTTDAKR